MAPHMSVRF